MRDAAPKAHSRTSSRVAYPTNKTTCNPGASELRAADPIDDSHPQRGPEGEAAQPRPHASA
jgi:hypothetical protein